MPVLWVLCVLSARGLCDGPITRSKESYRVWCAWVWSQSLDNEEVLVDQVLSNHGIGKAVIYKLGLPSCFRCKQFPCDRSNTFLSIGRQDGQQAAVSVLSRSTAASQPSAKTASLRNSKLWLANTLVGKTILTRDWSTVGFRQCSLSLSLRPSDSGAWHSGLTKNSSNQTPFFWCSRFWLRPIILTL
jgi:hypothetical protein